VAGSFPAGFALSLPCQTSPVKAGTPRFEPWGWSCPVVSATRSGARTMKHTDHGALVLVAAAVVLEALAITLRPVLAHTLALLLTIAGWEPARPVHTPRQRVPVNTATGAHRPRLEALPVWELRQLARAAGHRALARSGRRADLLAALAVA